MTIKLVFFVFSVLATSYLFGSRIFSFLKIESKYDWFKIPVGFYSFLGIYQLLVYPIQLFKLNTIYLIYILIALVIVVLIISIKEIKSLLKRPSPSWLFIIAFMGVSLVLFYICSTTFYLRGGHASGFNFALDDVFFYSRIIATNSIAGNPVNLIDPVAAMWYYDMSVAYAFTGILQFYGAISAIFKINPMLVTFWFSYALNSLLTAIMCVGFFKIVKGNIWLKGLVPLLIIARFFIGFSFINGFEPVYLRSFAIMALIVLVGTNYIKKQENKWLILFVLLSFGVLACQSTYFFLSIILFVSITVTDAIVFKRFNVHKLTFLASPTLIYGLAYIYYLSNYQLPSVIILLVIVINLLFYRFKKYFVWQIPIIILTILLSIMVIFAFINTNATYSLLESFDYFKAYYWPINLESSTFMSGKYDYVNKFMIPILMVSPLIFIIQWRKSDTNEKIYTIMLGSMVLLFYNPIVMPFISTFMTDVVYHRIANIVLNLWFYITLVAIISKKFKWFTIICFISALTFVPLLVNQTINQYEIFKQYKSSVNPIYKVDNQIVELSNFLDEYYQQPPVVLIPIELYNLRLINNEIVSSSLTPPWSEMYNTNYLFDYQKLSFPMQVQCYLEMPVDYFTNYYYQFENEKVPDIQGILLGSNTQVFMVKKWEDPLNEHSTFYELLDEIAQVIYEIEDYLVYEIYR